MVDLGSLNTKINVKNSFQLYFSCKWAEKLKTSCLTAPRNRQRLQIAAPQKRQWLQIDALQNRQWLQIVAPQNRQRLQIKLDGSVASFGVQRFGAIASFRVHRFGAVASFGVLQSGAVAYEVLSSSAHLQLKYSCNEFFTSILVFREPKSTIY